MQAKITEITGIRGTSIKLLEEDKGNLFIKFSSTEFKPYKYLYWMANEHVIL